MGQPVEVLLFSRIKNVIVVGINRDTIEALGLKAKDPLDLFVGNINNSNAIVFLQSNNGLIVAGGRYIFRLKINKTKLLVISFVRSRQPDSSSF